MKENKGIRILVYLPWNRYLWDSVGLSEKERLGPCTLTDTHTLFLTWVRSPSNVRRIDAAPRQATSGLPRENVGPDFCSIGSNTPHCRKAHFRKEVQCESRLKVRSPTPCRWVSRQLSRLCQMDRMLQLYLQTQKRIGEMWNYFVSQVSGGVLSRQRDQGDIRTPALGWALGWAV